MHICEKKGKKKVLLQQVMKLKIQKLHYFNQITKTCTLANLYINLTVLFLVFDLPLTI